MASGYHQLGMLAEGRGDYGEAERQYRRALEISERTGDPDGMSITYSQLGILAHRRGDYGEAERQDRRSLESLNGSAKSKAWPTATTSLAGSPRAVATTARPNARTVAP
jgi:hypothetical protein